MGLPLASSSITVVSICGCWTMGCGSVIAANRWARCFGVSRSWGGCKWGVGDTGREMEVVEDEWGLVFPALAAPTRRAILERLARGDARGNQLAEPFAMTQQAVSKHLKVLERASLIS